MDARSCLPSATHAGTPTPQALIGDMFVEPDHSHLSLQQWLDKSSFGHEIPAEDHRLAAGRCPLVLARVGLRGLG